jgi:hypothetical protein
MPIYCMTGCGANAWWTPSEKAPKGMTVYLGAGGFGTCC